MILPLHRSEIPHTQRAIRGTALVASLAIAILGAYAAWRFPTLCPKRISAIVAIPVGMVGVALAFFIGWKSSLPKNSLPESSEKETVFEEAKPSTDWNKVMKDEVDHERHRYDRESGLSGQINIAFLKDCDLRGTPRVRLQKINASIIKINRYLKHDEQIQQVEHIDQIEGILTQLREMEARPQFQAGLDHVESFYALNILLDNIGKRCNWNFRQLEVSALASFNISTSDRFIPLFTDEVEVDGARFTCYPISFGTPIAIQSAIIVLDGRENRLHYYDPFGIPPSEREIQTDIFQQAPISSQQVVDAIWQEHGVVGETIINQVRHLTDEDAFSGAVFCYIFAKRLAGGQGTNLTKRDLDQYQRELIADIIAARHLDLQIPLD